MNRRDFLFSSFMAAALLTKAPLAFAQAGSNGDTPYGAKCLEDTDLNKLARSIRQQMENAGKTVPAQFDPFPKKSEGDPLMATGADSFAPGPIIGESQKDPFINRIVPDFNGLYRTQKLPHCDGIALQSSFTAWRVFVALHETAHNIALQTVKDGANLNLYVFNIINKVSGADTSLYHDTINGSGNKPDTIKSFVAERTAINVPERIADTAATLYVLSNYEDTDGTKAFLQKMIDFREAHYMGSTADASTNPAGWIASWTKSDTASSIRAAIKDFESRGQKGMSIVETTQMAAEIITKQPEFQKTIDAMAADFNDAIGAKGNLWFGTHGKALTSDTGNLMKTMIDARERVCRQQPLSASTTMTDLMRPGSPRATVVSTSLDPH